MRQDKIILEDSPEGQPKYVQVSGWVANRYFYGEDKKSAIYELITHYKCKKCGAIYHKSSYCVDCYNVHESEKYEQMESVEWDGSSYIFSMARDKYYQDMSDVYDDLLDGETIESLMLVECTPNYIPRIDIDDNASDVTPDDGEIIFSSDIYELAEALNTAMTNMGPVSWSPGKKKIIVV